MMMMMMMMLILLLTSSPGYVPTHEHKLSQSTTQRRCHSLLYAQRCLPFKSIEITSKQMKFQKSFKWPFTPPRASNFGACSIINGLLRDDCLR